MSFEISPSSRAACRICNLPILKGELRYVKALSIGYDMSTDYYYHIRCVALSKPKLIEKFLSPHNKIWNQQFMNILEIKSSSSKTEEEETQKAISLLDHTILQAGDFFKGSKAVSEYAGRRFGDSEGIVIKGNYYNILTPSVILKLNNGERVEILSFSWVPDKEVELKEGLQEAFLEKSKLDDYRRIILVYESSIIPLFGNLAVNWVLTKISNDTLVELTDSY